MEGKRTSRVWNFLSTRSSGGGNDGLVVNDARRNSAPTESAFGIKARPKRESQVGYIYPIWQLTARVRGKVYVILNNQLAEYNACPIKSIVECSTGRLPSQSCPLIARCFLSKQTYPFIELIDSRSKPNYTLWPLKLIAEVYQNEYKILCIWFLFVS